MVGLTKAEINSCLDEAGIEEKQKPPYKKLHSYNTWEILRQLINRKKHYKFYHAVLKRVIRKDGNQPQDPSAEEETQQSITAYKIVLKELGVVDVENTVTIEVKRSGRDLRARFSRKTNQSSSRQCRSSKSFTDFLELEAPSMIYNDGPRTSFGIPALPMQGRGASSAVAASQSSDSCPIATPRISSASPSCASSSMDLGTVTVTIVCRLQPMLEHIKNSSNLLSSPFVKDVMSVCHKLRIPVSQEVRTAFVGQNNIGKSTVNDASLQATEESDAEYASNIAARRSRIEAGDELFTKQEWDVLKLEFGNEAASLRSEKELKLKLCAMLGYKEGEPSWTWRMKLPVPNADVVDEAREMTRERLSEYHSNPASLSRGGTYSYLVPLGRSTGVTTTTTMEFKYDEQFSRLLRFPPEEEMQRRAFQCITGLLDMLKLEDGETADYLQENILWWWADYCAVVKESKSNTTLRSLVKVGYVSPELVRYLLEDILRDLQRSDFPDRYQDVPVCEAAKRLAQQRYEIRYTAGRHGRDSDRVSLKLDLALLNDACEPALEEHHDESMLFSGLTSESSDDYFRKSRLSDLCIVYGPWNVLKGGIVFVDTCGLGDSDPEHGRQQEAVLGPVDRGGAEVVTALLEKDMKASATLRDALTKRSDIMADAREGRKLLILARHGEKSDMAVEHGRGKKRWCETSAGIKSHLKQSDAVKQKLKDDLEHVTRGKSPPAVFLNISWILYCSILHDPMWTPSADGDSGCTREAVLVATEMRQYLGALQYWRLKKTKEEVDRCLDIYSSAYRVLKGMDTSDMTRRSRELLKSLQKGDWASCSADDAVKADILARGKTKINTMVGYIMCNGEDADGELDKIVMRRLGDEKSLSKDCSGTLLSKRAMGNGLTKPKSMKAALNGGSFTLTTYSTKEALEPQKKRHTLAEFLMICEGTSDVDAIGKGIVEYMDNLIMCAIEDVRERCTSALVDGMRNHFRENQDEVEGEELEILARWFMRAKEKSLFAAKHHMEAQFTKTRHKFWSLGLAAYKDYIQRSSRTNSGEIHDEAVRERVGEVVVSSRKVWMENLTSLLNKVWKECVDKLSGSAQKLVSSFGSWRSNNREVVDLTLGNLTNLVGNIMVDLKAVSKGLGKSLKEADVGTEEGLSKLWGPLHSELVQASKLGTVCETRNGDQLLPLPNKAAIYVGHLSSLNRNSSLRSAIVIKAHLDPTHPARIEDAGKELKKAEAAFRGSTSRTEAHQFLAELHKDNSAGVKSPTLAVGLFQACYQYKPGDLSGASSVLSLRLKQCEELWHAALKQAGVVGDDNPSHDSVTLLHALALWCHVHQVDVMLCRPPKVILYIHGSRGGLMNELAYVLLAEQHSEPKSLHDFDFYAATLKSSETSAGQSSGSSRGRKRKIVGEASASGSGKGQHGAPAVVDVRMAHPPTTTASGALFASPDDLLQKFKQKRKEFTLKRRNVVKHSYHEFILRKVGTKEESCVLVLPDAKQGRRFAYFKECVSYRLPAAWKERNPATGMAGEDSHSSSFCHLAVMDGATSGNTDHPLDYRLGSGRKAMLLAMACKDVAMPLALTVVNAEQEGYNHSLHVLMRAADAVSEHVKACFEYPEHGSTTALVASTFNSQLHIASLGDCRLALLRKDGEGVKVVYLSKKTTVRLCGNDTPMQMGLVNPTELEDLRRTRRVNVREKTIEVKEGDLVVVGSECFFHNLVKCEGADDAAKIKSRLEELCDSAAHEADNGIGTLTQRAGKSLYLAATDGMHNGPRARIAFSDILGRHARCDDLTLLVSQISLNCVTAVEQPPTIIAHTHPLPNLIQDASTQPYPLTRQRTAMWKQLPNIEGKSASWRFKGVHSGGDTP